MTYEGRGAEDDEDDLLPLWNQRSIVPSNRVEGGREGDDLLGGDT